MKNIFNLFRKKIVIPLYKDKKPNGQWVECYKGDETYKQILKVYGEIPDKIIVESLVKD